MNKMKKIGRIYWMLLIILCTACNDPYEGDTFSVYDIQPAATYLSSRSGEFSEWISIMKYADLYNAVNQATQYFTLFVPTNEAVKAFYTKKGITSIEELGVEYARNLVSFHIVQDTISQEKFIEQEGTLSKKTVSDDFLSVSFGSAENGGGGLQSVYLNKEAHVIEFANLVSNGYVYVLENTLTPLTESVYQRIAENGDYTILKGALDATGWGKEINTIYDTIENQSGGTTQQKRNYTFLAVTDAVFSENGISSLQDLVRKLEAGSDYTNPDNALYQYVAYHILPGSYDLKKMRSFDTADVTSKIWDTSSTGNIVKVSNKNDIFYLNYADEEHRATFLEDYSDLQAKNGYIHQVSTWLPIAEAEPETVLFDLCNYSLIGEWIAAGHGEEGIKFQAVGDEEKKCSVTELNCYQYELVNLAGAYDSYYNVTYFQISSKNDWKTANNGDLLMLNIGNTGWVSMQTPSIIKGKYKVTLQFGYATSQLFIKQQSNSNGGQMDFKLISGTEEVLLNEQTEYKPYTELEGSAPKLGLYKSVINNEIEFTDTQSYTLKIVLKDPGASASSNSKYRIYLDYILFEPVIEE